MIDLEEKRMKPCKTCRVPKELSDFHKCTSAKDGRQSVCKLCRNEYVKEYRKTNKDRIAEYGKEYSKANRGHIYERVKRQLLGDPEKRAERTRRWSEAARRWREANPEKVAEQAKRKEEKRKNKCKQAKLDIRHD